MKTASFLLAVLSLLGFSLARADAPDLRFSQSLSAEDRAAGGLTLLTSDEVAVIDALVRRDTTKRLETTASDKPSPTFSQRLSESERSAAGLAKLGDELPKLDGLIDRFQNARLARSLLAPPRYLARARIPVSETKKEREIHGSFSLSFGWGSGGYSERTGSMVVNVQEVLPGVSLTVGYSETHIKNGQGRIYRDPFYRDPLYRDPFYPDSELPPRSP
jgi:hypothetical protein